MLLITLSCSKEKEPSAFDLIQGKWKLSKVEWSNGKVDEAPNENSYFLILNSTKSQNTFIQADAESWDMFTVENNFVLARLPRAFGS